MSTRDFFWYAAPRRGAMSINPGASRGTAMRRHHNPEEVSQGMMNGTQDRDTPSGLAPSGRAYPPVSTGGYRHDAPPGQCPINAPQRGAMSIIPGASPILLN